MNEMIVKVLFRLKSLFGGSFVDLWVDRWGCATDDLHGCGGEGD